MILQIRGGSGSGKTSLVRAYLLAHGGQPLEERSRPFGRGGWQTPRNVFVYRCDTGVLVPGRYNLEPLTRVPGAGGTSGGDYVIPYANGSTGGDHALVPACVELLLELVREGPVLVESVKELGRDTYAELTAHTRVVWATLDTPPEEAIRRIYERRTQTGRNLNRPLKEDSMRSGVRRRQREAANPPPGVESYWLDHRDPLPQLEYLLSTA